MKIRDSFAILTDNQTEYSMPNGIEIVADDGKTLFSLSVDLDGTLEVSSGGGVVKHDTRLLDSGLMVMPRASNVVRIRRALWSQ